MIMPGIPQWVPGIFYVSTLYYPNYSGLGP